MMWPDVRFPVEFIINSNFGVKFGSLDNLDNVVAEGDGSWGKLEG